MTEERKASVGKESKATSPPFSSKSGSATVINHCFEICHYQQNVPQHYYLLDTVILKSCLCCCLLATLAAQQL